MKIIESVCLVLFLGFLFAVNVFAQNEKKSPEKPNKQAGSERFFKKSPFRYVIVAGESELEKYVNRFSGSMDFQVLMEDKDFNEKNLEILGGLMSKRFKNTVLSFWVYASMDAIKTPEEQDQSSLYGPVDDYFKYKRAYFFVNPEGEIWFKYSIPGADKEKTVVLQSGKP